MSTPFIIAEVGSNWATLDDCLTSIHLAAKAGADAVKFQAYTHNALYGLSKHPDAAPLGGPMYQTSYAELGKSIWNDGIDKFNAKALPLSWLPKLAEKAKACGIKFMCSAFSPELAEAVNPHVEIHKVASAELTHKRLLEKLRSFGKPVILSTGASGDEDIRLALKHLEGVPVTLLYCVAAYPARRVNVYGMQALKEEFGYPVGFSDHTTDVLVIPYVFARNGAAVIEKHVNFVGADGPDAPHSLTGDEFRDMVEIVKHQKASFPNQAPEEKPMILRHNRRIIATRNIEAGEVLREDTNFGIYRSLKDDTHAFSPWLIDAINGKVAKKAISAGSGIGPGDI